MGDVSGSPFRLAPLGPICNGRDTLPPLRARTENCSEEAMTGMQHDREEAEREGTVVAPNATWPNMEPQLFCHLVVLDHPRLRGPQQKVFEEATTPARGLHVGGMACLVLAEFVIPDGGWYGVLGHGRDANHRRRRVGGLSLTQKMIPSLLVRSAVLRFFVST
ncbi:hypothetical protein QBC45DRAFT_430906 [Copromyces sp. CBS 386.78]|nr:hypothetical protein QBC45DRAFT_430906 [Copromyces sp. CBS 386.78]